MAIDEIGKTLTEIDRVLAVAPQEPQPLWNRAMAIHQLELPRTAAAAFDEVAALGDPALSAEARALAKALRGACAAREREWQLADAAGKAMMDATPPPLSSLRAFPGLMRHYLYWAVRAAETREQLLPLLPAARELDSIEGRGLLTALVEATAASDLRAGAPRARARRELQLGWGPPAASEEERREGWRQKTLVLQTGADELRALIAARRDPWHVALLALSDARSSGADAEGILSRAIDECKPAQVDYQCAQMQYQLARVHLKLAAADAARAPARAAAAQALAIDGLARGRAAGVDGRMEVLLLFTIAEAAQLGHADALGRAYRQESELRNDEL